jgi:transcriptional regulator, XRE family
MKINERIRARRKELGLTLKQVAEKLNVSESLISRYESNDVKNMGIDKISPLAEVLKTTPSYLMGWDDVVQKPETPPVVDTSVLTAEELAEFEKVTQTNKLLFFNGIEDDDHDMAVFKNLVIDILLKQRKNKEKE